MEDQRRRAATLVDVARRAGVSRQTVSNVLNAPERVSAATTLRVREAIDALDYVPHQTARNLRSQSTGLLGYAVPSQPIGTINDVMELFLKELCRAAGDVDRNVLLVSARPGESEADALADLVGSRRVDACVIADIEWGDQRVAELRGRDVPFVAFGRAGDAVAHSRVDVDNAAGISAAVRHLVADGHERVAMIGWPAGSAVGDVRVDGWRDSLVELGFAPDERLLVRGPDGPHTGARAVRDWIDDGMAPTALVCASDAIAIGAMRAAQERGLSVGRFADLAVVGFDDTPVAPLLTPALTSVRQPMGAAASAIVQRLVALTEHHADPDEDHEVLVTPELVTRETA